MKAVLILAAAITVVMMVGCGERNSPFQPEQYFHLMSETETPGRAMDVAVLNDTAYVADGWGGIAVVDIRDAANPIYLESWPGQFNVKLIRVAPINRVVMTYEIAGVGGVRIY